MSLDVAALYAQEHGRLVNFIHKRMDGCDLAVAEDLAADVFERAVRAAPRYQARGISPSAWLYQIARNLLIDHYRRRGLVAIVRLGDLKPYVTHVGTSDHLARIDAQAAVQHALRTFHVARSSYPPDKQIAVIRERFFRGGTDKEIGARLGLTVMATKKLRLRALANLRKRLEAA